MNAVSRHSPFWNKNFFMAAHGTGKLPLGWFSFFFFLKKNKHMISPVINLVSVLSGVKSKVACKGANPQEIKMQQKWDSLGNSVKNYHGSIPLSLAPLHKNNLHFSRLSLPSKRIIYHKYVTKRRGWVSGQRQPACTADRQRVCSS